MPSGGRWERTTSLSSHKCSRAHYVPCCLLLWEVRNASLFPLCTCCLPHSVYFVPPKQWQSPMWSTIPLFPSLLSEVSTVLKTGATSKILKKKRKEKRKKNYCHINFYSNHLAHFSSSFAGDQGSLPAPQPSIPRDSECWHKLKPGDLPLSILILAGVSVRLIDSTQPSLVKSSDRKE